jgi:hypothetical protein
MASGGSSYDSFVDAIYKYHLPYVFTQKKPVDERLGIALFGMADGSR